MRVDVIERQSDLRSIDDHPVLRQPPLCLQQLVKVPTAHKVLRNHHQ